MQDHKPQPQTTAELQRLARARVELELAQRRGDLQRAGELMYGVIPDIERQLKDLPMPTETTIDPRRIYIIDPVNQTDPTPRQISCPKCGGKAVYSPAYGIECRKCDA